MAGPVQPAQWNKTRDPGKTVKYFLHYRAFSGDYYYRGG